MAITIRQLWNEYIFRGMAHLATQKGGLFNNGIIAYDTSPTFRQGDTRHRMPYVSDLETILGSDDQRLIDGTDLTIKSIDGSVGHAPIVYRGDAMGQSLISQTQMGVNAIASLGSQVGAVALNRIEKRLGHVITGVFGSGGPLASSHVHDVKSRRLSIGDPKQARADVYGENAADVDTGLLLVNSQVEADLYKRSLITYTQLTAAGNPQAVNTGNVPVFGGARLAVNDRVASAVNHAFTATNATNLFTVAAGHGFVEDDAVVFTGDDLPNGITAGTTYYVIAANLTTTTFQVATSKGGSAVAISDDGTGTMTVFGRQYYSYLVAPRSLYVGIQRDFDVTEYEKHLDGGKKFVRYWTQFYAPSVVGCSYDATTINPTDANLETGSDWSVPGDARDVGIVRVISKIDQPE